MRVLTRVLGFVLSVLILGFLGYYVFVERGVFSRCATPVTYTVLVPDSRFSISEEVFAQSAREAASLWNEAYGKTLFVSGDSGIQVSLVYDERQEALALGDTLEEGQQEYRAMRTQIEQLRVRYEDMRSAYERAVFAYNTDIAAYEEDVRMWNERGGAPPEVYAQLAARKAAIERTQTTLERDAARIESAGRDINIRVTSLNTLVERLNISAETFNEILGHDFDQGHFVSDGGTEQIVVYTFENREELVRVLAHEFGHALGIAHTEDPESIMYAYNLGTSLTLTDEDRAALSAVCSS